MSLVMMPCAFPRRRRPHRSLALAAVRGDRIAEVSVLFQVCDGQAHGAAVHLVRRGDGPVAVDGGHGEQEPFSTLSRPWFISRSGLFNRVMIRSPTCA